MKQPILRRIKADAKKRAVSAHAPRSWLDAPPISRLALLKGARMGMACVLVLLLSMIIVQGAPSETSEFKPTRALAKTGDAHAQYQLGRMYEFGEGTHPDSIKAVHWYRKAAEQGLAPAQYNLARMYSAGESINRDPRTAAHWLHRAAAANYLPAWNRLGVAYERGEGVSKDPIEAYKWYTLAARAGHIAGVVNRDHLKTSMSQEQIAQAEMLAGQRSTRNFSVILNANTQK